MTLLNQTFESGLSNGTQITAANSGGGGSNAYDSVGATPTGGSALYDNTHVAHGSQSLKISTGTAGAVTLQYTTSVPATTSQIWGWDYVYLTAYPPSGVILVKGLVSTNQIYKLGYDSTGHVFMEDEAGTKQITTTNAIALNQWVRIEHMVISSATVGQLEIKLFNSAEAPLTSPTETKTSPASLNTTGGNFGTLQKGSLVAVTSFTWWLDESGFSTTGYHGPSTTPTPGNSHIYAGLLGLTGGPAIPIVHPLPSAIAVPGETLLGIYEKGGLFSSQAAFETVLGRQFSGHKGYCDASNGNNGKPGTSTDGMLQAAEQNGFVHVSFQPELFSGTSAALVSPQAGITGFFGGHPWFGFDDAISGALDPVFAQWANSVSLLPCKVIVDFSAEPDDTPVPTTAKTSADKYADAVRRMDTVFKAQGCTNYELAWNVSGFQTSGNINAMVGGTVESLTFAEFYALLYGVGSIGGPLDDIVTWVLWEPYYDSAGKTDAHFMDFYNNLIAPGNLTVGAQSKCFGLGEWGIGSGFSTNAARAAAFTGIPAVMIPGLQYAMYWDSDTTAGPGPSGSYKDYRVQGTSDGSIAAFETMTASFI